MTWPRPVSPAASPPASPSAPAVVAGAVAAAVCRVTGTRAASTIFTPTMSRSRCGSPAKRTRTLDEDASSTSIPIPFSSSTTRARSSFEKQTRSYRSGGETTFPGWSSSPRLQCSPR